MQYEPANRIFDNRKNMISSQTYLLYKEFKPVCKE